MGSLEDREILWNRWMARQHDASLVVQGSSRPQFTEAAPACLTLASSLSHPHLQGVPYSFLLLIKTAAVTAQKHVFELVKLGQAMCDKGGKWGPVDRRFGPARSFWPHKTWAGPVL